MSQFFLYHHSTKKTGRKIAQALGIPHGETPPTDKLDILIRWGATRGVALKPKSVINSKKAIQLSSDKLASLAYLRSRGVPVPVCSRLTEYNIAGFNFPALARNVQHREGLDIILCLQEQDAWRALHSRDYLVQYIPTRCEYRVHVIQGRAVKVSQKVLTVQDDYCSWMRNFRTGHTFRIPTVALAPWAELTAIHAVSCLGLNFGAVDVIISDSGQPFILEINTAPGLIDKGVWLYAQQLAPHLEVSEEKLNPDHLILQDLDTEELTNDTE